MLAIDRVQLYRRILHRNRKEHCDNVSVSSVANGSGGYGTVHSLILPSSQHKPNFNWIKHAAALQTFIEEENRFAALALCINVPQS